MKKRVISVVLLVVLLTLAVSCQKENLVESQSSTIENGTVRTIHYFVDGILHVATIHDDDEAQALILYLLTLTREGKEVVFFDEDVYSSIDVTKETVVYKTNREEDANEWSLNMMADGYKVSIVYDSTHGVYICTATK